MSDSNHAAPSRGFFRNLLDLYVSPREAYGGILGIAIGGGLAFLINAFSPFPALLQPTWVLIAFGTAVGVGLTFGLWPAVKAARLDPIEALRYE